MLTISPQKTSIIFLGCVILLFACSKWEPSPPADADILDGPIEGLNHAENIQFLAGDIAFNDEIFTIDKGLGSLFVANSCGSCHAGDGKGTPFTTLTRFGQSDSTGNRFLHAGGPQLQHRAIPGYTPESIPTNATYSKFTPPANTGLGYIQSVSDETILAMSDPTDSNGDGISGVPNWNTIPAYVSIPGYAITRNGKYICRFGKKASTFDLLQQTVTAYNQDIGITSTFEPRDVYSGNKLDPEVSDKTVRDVVAYLLFLKAPIQRNSGDREIISGKKLFIQANCNACHTPELKTAISPIAVLSDKTFYPYTDLLLHDMGKALDDGYTEGSAKTFEWRTAPLWGLGLSPGSQSGQYYLMHDGRARSIEEAILMHGGEAEQSKANYTKLSSSEKTTLIKFLESL